MNNAAVFGKKFVGGLVGYCYNGSLSGCRVSGTVCGTDDVGILCGYANETSVTGCGAAGTIVCTGSNGGGLVGRVKGGKPVLRCQANASVGGGDNLGGLIGQIAGGSMLGNGAYLTVSDSFSRSRIRGNGGVGGIAGNASNAVLSNCYWAGTLTSSGMQGSLVGKYSESLALSGCCYDRNGCAAAVAGFSRPGAIALSSSEMKMQSSYYGWDFDLIWALDPDLNGGMPYLREHTPEPEELPQDPSLSVSGLTEENGTAVVDLTVYVPEAAEVKLALAVYQNGRMMGISFVDQTLTAGENTASLTVSIPEGSCTYELFLVSGADYVPMAEQLRFSAGDR